MQWRDEEEDDIGWKSGIDLLGVWRSALGLRMLKIFTSFSHFKAEFGIGSAYSLICLYSFEI